MILIEVEQGDDAWHWLRMGVPTASEFHRVVTPAQGVLAKGRSSYVRQLVVQRLLGEMPPALDNLPAIERGKVLEPDAVRHYAFLKSDEGSGASAKAGIVYSDNMRYAASPDRFLCDEAGLLEIKCPGAEQHLKYWDEGLDNEYRCQLQGQLLVTGLPFVDFMSFHPELPEYLTRVERDEDFIAKLRKGLGTACDEIDELAAKVTAAGYVSRDQAIPQLDDKTMAMLRRHHPWRFERPMRAVTSNRSREPWEGASLADEIADKGWG